MTDTDTSVDAPNPAKPLLKRAAALMQAGGPAEEALALLDQALAVGGESPMARMRRVQLLASLGRGGEAAVDLRTLSQASQDDGKRLGRQLSESGEVAAALATLRSLQEIAAGDPTVRAGLIRLIVQMAPRKIKGRHSVRRIHQIAEFIKARSYLEVGVSRGKTFNAVELPRKVAVDPEFRFDLEEFKADGVDFLEIPSDEYFEVHKPQEKFDIIFLDGLHEFHQTLRDFENTLGCSHPGTIWLIDDVLPCDEFSALPDEQECPRLRAETGSDSHKWHGDIYKVMFAIHDFFPDFDYVSINSDGNGQALVWRAPRGAVEPVLGSMEAIDRLDYAGMLERQDVLRFCDEDDAFAALHASIDRERAAGRWVDPPR